MARKRGPRDWARYEHYQKYGTWPKNPNASKKQNTPLAAPEPVVEAPKAVEPTAAAPALFEASSEDSQVTPKPRKMTEKQAYRASLESNYYLNH
jgi:hypothetical protein